MSPPRPSKPTPPAASTYRHAAASRPNQPTVGTEPLMSDEQRAPLPFHVDRRDITHPALAWDRQGRTSRMEGDPSTDGTHTFAGVPLYTQEKINPLAMIEQLRRPDTGIPLNLFDDFNGLPPEANTWEFYQHSGHWQNRLVHGDSSEVMQSLIVPRRTRRPSPDGLLRPPIRNSVPIQLHDRHRPATNQRQHRQRSTRR